MKNDLTVAELLSRADLPAAFETAGSASDDFRTLIEILHLDPANDLRFSDLTGVDFSNTDLRGYDFCGADLRNSYGICITIDDSTNFEGADLQGSCFATLQRERSLFQENPTASKMYDALKSGDPFDISRWLHARYGKRPEEHRILRKIDADTCSILCQKLITDDIDLTKRTDLFYFLWEIVPDESDRRELILSILARHSENHSVIDKFINIAGRLYSNDPVVLGALVRLCDSGEERTREAAFLAIFETKYVLEKFDAMKSAFMDRKNTGIRKRLIFSTAVALGRKYIAAVNLRASPSDVPVSEILDFPDLLDNKCAPRIAAEMQKRNHENIKRIDSTPPYPARAPATAPQNAIIEIKKRQEAVLCSTPVLNVIFLKEQPSRAKEALRRLASR